MTSQIKTTELPIAFNADFDSSDFVLILDDGITKRLSRQAMIDNFLPFMQGEKGDTGATGIKGEKGDKGDIGLTGATGAQGIQGVQGIAGATGAQGQKGWSPILAVASDGARRVLQVVDWTGGAGTKPASGSYIGDTGFVVNIGNAIDIRGSQGATGSTGATGAAGTNGADGTSAKQISTITHEANNAIKTTFTDTTSVTSDAPKRLLGWASYQDQVYTSIAPFALVDGIKATLPNNAAISLTTTLPTGVTSLYNALTSKITPAAVGDGLHLVVRFMAIPSAVNTYLSFGVDIGAGADIFQDTIVLPRGAGTPNPVNIGAQGFALSTFLTNGGLIKLTAVGGNVQVYGIEFQIHRTSVV